MLKINNLSKKYGELNVLENITFQIGDEEIVAIVGPSGCGKTTILKMIAGLDNEMEGTIKEKNQNISFVFQDDRLLPWRNVLDNIRLVEDHGDMNEALQLVEEVGLKGFEKYYPDQLSGGMKKRCGIARAFYHKNELLLMDEPFTGLDCGLQREMLNLLKNVLNTRRQSVLFITHDIDEALFIADRVLVLTGRPATIKKEIIVPKGKTDNQEMEQVRMDIIKTIMEESRNEYFEKSAS